jgi:anti-sigma28 factor (negative regulator of flagellin synthesis)
MTKHDVSSVKSTLEQSDILIQQAHLHAILFDTQDAMNTKIELIRDEIESGRYTINNTHIAAKLLELAPLTTCLEEVEA